MEKQISRRDFLKISAIGAGVITLGHFLDSPIGKIIDGANNGKNEEKLYLDNKFEPLDGNLFDSNFNFFKGIFGEIDSTIHFKRGLKIEFKNNIFSIPYNFKYKDIPEFLLVLKKRIKSPVFEQVISGIKEKYENKAYFIYKNGINSTNKDFYINEAIKVFSISCLYSGICDEIEILKRFEKLINTLREDIQTEKEIKKISIKFESQSRKNNIKITNFELNNEEKKEYFNLKTLEEKQNFLYNKILNIIKNSNIEYKNEIQDIVRNLIITKLKVYEIMTLSQEEGLSSIVQDIKSYLTELLYRNDSSKVFQKEVEKLINLDLKKDFEKGIYSTLTKDIHPELKNKIKQSIQESMITFENPGFDSKNYIEYTTLIDFALKNCSNEELKEFKQILKKKIKPYPIKELLISIPKKHHKELYEFLKKITNTYESEKFKEIIKDIKSGNFTSLKEKSKYLSNDEKINILYLIFSTIGGNIYSDLISKKISLGKFASIYSPKLENKVLKNVIGSNNEIIMSIITGSGFLETKERINTYETGQFQIDQVKKLNGKYNCMTISIIGNYIIEELFGLEGKGISIFKQNGEKTSHIFNGIMIGDKIVSIDITNNNYYIDDKTKIDDKNYYDIMDFANAYMVGAIDNIGAKEGSKFFYNKKRLKYIKSYIDNYGDETQLLKANRNKSIQRRNL